MYLRDHLPPQLRGFQHVGFIHRGDKPPSLAGRFKRDPGNPRNFFSGVDFGIKSPVAGRRGLHAFGRPEINTARQFPHDEDIDPLNDLTFERGRIG